MKSLRLLAATSSLFLTMSLPVVGQTVNKESFRGHEVVSGEIIVRFQPANSVIQALATPSGITSMESIGGNGAMILRSVNRSTEELIQAYAGRPDVVYAEPNYIWHKSDIPNDTRFAEQWALRNTGQTVGGQTGIANADIHVVPAWDTVVGSNGVVVGVVDTGIDFNHPDLVSNLWSAPAGVDVTIRGQSIHCAIGTHGFNAITKTCDPLDDEGHGTHVSGILGATGNNGLGVTGVSRVSSVMALKFLDSTGSGTTSNAIDAIEFAIQVNLKLGINVRVLNASWGGATFSQALLDEINSANARDMLFVAAAGNDGANTDITPDFPSSFDLPNIISVAATDNRDALASFSNFGVSNVDIGAPGVGILSTLPVSQGSFGFASGTSMSTPMVSGAAALILAACPAHTAELKADLLGTVDQISSLFGKTMSGGRLNVAQALGACNGTGSGTFNVNLDSGSHVAIRNGSTAITVNVVAINGFSGTVNLSASNLPASVTASFNPASVTGSGSSTLTLSAASGASTGAFTIQVSGSSGAITQVTGVSFLVPGSINPGQPVNSSLTISDSKSIALPGSFADFFQLTLNSATTITIDLRSTVFDSFLILRSASGAILNSDNDSGGSINARIGPVMLAAGNYLVEATSLTPSSTGNYFLGVNCPTVDSITPNSGQAGTTVNVTLNGNGFAAPVSVGFFSPVSNVTVVDSNTIAATFALSNDAQTGVHNISVTSAGGAVSNTIPFTVTPAFPALTSINPAFGVPGTTVSIRFFGFGFTSGMTVDVGDGIAVSGITSTDTDAKMTFSIAASASSGVHSATFTTSLGTSNALPFVVSAQPPTLTGINPASLNVGSGQFITITGTNFSTPMTVDAGGNGVTFGSVNIVSPTQASVSASVAQNAVQGPRNVTVTTPAGTSNPVTLSILVSLGSISPDHVGQGSTFNMALVGDGFNAPMSVDAGNDIVVSNVVITNSSNAKATLTVSGTATLGNRNVTVTTSGGTSSPRTLTILAPFPDLTITDTRAPSFGAGYNEDYNLVVSNLGSVPTTTPTTVTYSLQSPVKTLASSVGAGSTCSVSGTTVTCIQPATIAGGAQSALTLTVAVDSSSGGTVLSTFSVSNTGDLDTVNNSITDPTTIVRVPQAAISLPSSIVSSGMQLNTGVTIPSPFPHPLSGTLSLSFTPTAVIPIDDPAIQFSSGGRQVAYTIPANTTQADFDGNPAIGIQTGTVSGTTTLSATLVAGTVPPPAIPSPILIFPAQAPVITNVLREQTGLSILVTSYSNTRQVNSITFTFNTTPGVKLSCGSVSGCTAAGSAVTFDVQSLFNNWYLGDTTFGGTSILRVPFTIDGSLKGTVSVTETNSSGISNVLSLALP